MKVIRVPFDQIEKLENLLKSSGLRKRDIKNTLWSYEDEGIYLNMYPSGTLLIQGKKADEWFEKILSQIEVPESPLAGCDEVGKGDIFGPLVLCCAVIPPENFLEVLKLNPKDSKTMKDEEILKKAKLLRKLVKIRCVTLMPERFNELYEEYRNINRLMDAAYEKIIMKVNEEFNPEAVVVDRYSSRDPFQRFKNVTFIEKGERDIAVSIASIVARAKFLEALDKLENETGIKIPKGASGEAKHLAKEILKGSKKLAHRLIKISFLK